jgi:hypothetical protein
MYDDFSENASTQYGDWKGTFAGDDVDMGNFETMLGVDRKLWRLMAINIETSGGSQYLSAYGIPAEVGYVDLEAVVGRGDPVELTLVAQLDSSMPDDAFDTNPPPPPAIPVTSVLDLLAHGFKRSNLRFVTRNLPEGAVLKVVGSVVPDE